MSEARKQGRFSRFDAWKEDFTCWRLGRWKVEGRFSRLEAWKMEGRRKIFQVGGLEIGRSEGRFSSFEAWKMEDPKEDFPGWRLGRWKV